MTPKLHQEIEQYLRAQLLELVNDDVVLDFSLWSRRSRMEYRALLKPLGVVAETVYLATSRDIVLERMAARRQDHSDDDALSRELTEAYFDHFEPPATDEELLIVNAETR